MLDFLADDVVGSDGPFGLNGLVELLTDGTGAVAADVSSLAPVVVPIPGLANLSFSLRSLNASGLTSLTTPALFGRNKSKGEAHTLTFEAGLGSLDVAAQLHLEVTPVAGLAHLGGHPRRRL